MRRWLAPLVMVVSCATVAPTLAGGRGPVCREPSVVDEITREIRDRSYYGEVDPKLVTEAPTTVPNVVRCQVCVLSAPYLMTRFGDEPVGQCLEHGFEVQILHSGFVVRDLK
jgi:hypothetical protein